jgi:hypothetical protein
MSRNNWTQKEEDDWKEAKEKFFDKQPEKALKQYKDPLIAGDRLGQLLRESEKEAVDFTTPRAVKKWASKGTFGKWEIVLKDKKMLAELRVIGKSIANTLRPLAGHKFSQWVCKVLNKSFEHYNLPLECTTKGKIKESIAKKLIVKNKGKTIEDFKPDIDIVVLKKIDKKLIPLAIISTKTTLAERIMQTINWRRYIKQLPREVKQLRIYLVTAWEDFKSGTNRERVQELDGIFVCNEDVFEYGKIKKFSKILKEFKKIL